MKLVKLLTLTLVVLLIACSKQDKLENHIPENSIF
jgi:major membrane immunogen (membrane-anchored lipoprotein)